MGRQLYDDRIFLENRPGSNENEVVGSLIIRRVKRTDDGLYECLASNSVSILFPFVYKSKKQSIIQFFF